MKLNNTGLKDGNWWEERGYEIPKYNREQVKEQTLQEPAWIHFGAGNIFRAFLANVAEGLLNRGEMNRGLIVAEGFDYEILEKGYQAQDNYSILATLKADGTVDKTVIGSVVESVALDFENQTEAVKLKEFFAKKSLQMASFTITEKGYRMADESGNTFQAIADDFANGPECAKSYLGKVVALLVTRYQNGGYPIAMVSMDNCSHNGEKLEAVVSAFIKEWIDRGFVDSGFETYIKEKGSA